MLKTRARLVNFRVTQEELDYLKRACAERGARSVSDFARSAVLRAASDGTDPLSVLEGQMERLGQKLSQIEESLRQFAPPAPARSPLAWKPDAALRDLDRALRASEGPAAESVTESGGAGRRC